MEDLRSWVALSMLRAIDRFNAGSLVERFGGPGSIFSSTQRELEAFSGDLARSVAEFKDWERVDKELKSVERDGARVVAYVDPEYPALLRRTYDPPCLLYVKGRRLSGEAAVGIVGTRHPTHYGLRMSESLGRDLAYMGVTVVSGMARGCDMAAHKGALSAGGYTIAVLGTGVDIAYPKENARLYSEIADKGSVVSEYPMSTPPLQHNFPRRNRIISGLSLGVVVVEAPLRSGSLMTARLALEYGREVFAVPGQATSLRSSGANKLIKDGAPLVENAVDIAAALSISPRPGPKEAAGSTDAPAPGLGGDEGALWEALEGGPAHIDSIVEATGLTVARASTALLALELKGLIEQHPGKSFSRRM